MLLLLAAATVVPAGDTFARTPVRVWDGDGPLWCAEGPGARLAGIAARESDGTCRAGHLRHIEPRLRLLQRDRGLVRGRSLSSCPGSSP